MPKNLRLSTKWRLATDSLSTKLGTAAGLLFWRVVVLCLGYNAVRNEIMLIPRFSMRWLLVAVTFFSGVSYVVAIAFKQQETWAISLSLALAGITVLALVHMALFGLALILAKLVYQLKDNPTPDSPFATEKLPPQVIRPTVPEEI